METRSVPNGRGVVIREDGVAAPAHIRFFQGFVEGNYFYVFSALLMMLGSYLLMSSSLVQGTAFARTLSSLSILQGYEALIVVTAAAIVWRFRRLGDAYTLFVIELVLLLDPTFFSNAFTTLPNTETPPFDVRWVNFGCFVVMAAKLGVLLAFLRLRFSPRTLLAFLGGGVFVYLAEGPLNNYGSGLSREGYYYALGWVPLAVAALFPPASEAVAVRAGKEGYITARQVSWMPRFVVGLPLLIMASHFFESANVYGIRFYWTYGAPLLLVLALVIAKHWPRAQAGQGIFAVDVVCGFALLISLPILGVEAKSAIHGAAPPTPAFLLGALPAVACGAAVVVLYAYYAWKHAYRPALVRVGVLGVGAAIYGLIKGGVISFGFDVAGSVLTSIWTFVAANPWLVATAAWAGLLAVAIRFPRYATWFAFGLYTIVFAGSLLPGPVGRRVPEMLQAVLVLGLVLSHVYGGWADRGERMVAALVLASIGFLRFALDGSVSTGCVVAAEAAALVAAGVLLRHKGYGIVGVLDALVLIGYLGRHVPESIPPAVAVLLAGLGLFLVGVLVTFQKERILVWFRRWEEAARRSTPALAATGALGVTGDVSGETPSVPAPPPPPPWPRGSRGATPRSNTGAPPVESLPPTDVQEEEYKDTAIPPDDGGESREGESEKNLGGESLAVGEPEKVPEEPGDHLGTAEPPDKQDQEPLDEDGLHSVDWKEEPPMELEIHTQKTMERGQILRSLFLTDLETGIFLAEELDPRTITDAASGIDWFPGETLVVCFAGRQEGIKPWPIVLTSMRIVYRPPERRQLVSVYYSQIAFLARQLGTVLLSGHSGQVLLCHGLTTPQAAALKRGLERLLAETALDPPSDTLE